MSDNTVFVIIVLVITLALTTCSVGNNWRLVEMEKLQLEREKMGIKK